MFFSVFRASSMMSSSNVRVVKSTLISGSIPNSMCFFSASRCGLAEKRTPHPFGSSEVKGNPAPPPVWSPISMALGMYRMALTNSFAALYTLRLVNTATGFCQRMRLDGSIYCGSGCENSLCPGPVLCMIYPVCIFSLVKRAAMRSAKVSVPPPLSRTSKMRPLHGAK